MKNKNRKLLFYFIDFLLIISIILIPIVLVIGGKSTIPSIIFIHDTNLNDDSMNEYSYLGIQNSTENWNEMNNTNYTYSDFHSSTREDELNSLVKSFIQEGTDLFIFSGYRFEYWLDLYASEFPNNSFFVYIDDGNKKYFTSEFENVISIYFESSQASFAAGILASMYVTNNYPDPNDWKIGMWGGTEIPAVINIMSGFESGINFFNEFILKDSVEFNVQLIHPNIGWYTGSYESNSSGRNAALNLISNGAKVLFPVAGGQSYDAMSVITNVNSTGEKVKLIGMDTDAKVVFPDSQEYILTSVIKDFEKLTYDISDALWTYYENTSIPFGVSDSIANWQNGWVNITDLQEKENIELFDLFIDDENNLFEESLPNISYLSLDDFISSIVNYSILNNYINNDSSTFKS